MGLDRPAQRGGKILKKLQKERNQDEFLQRTVSFIKEFLERDSGV